MLAFITNSFAQQANVTILKQGKNKLTANVNRSMNAAAYTEDFEGAATGITTAKVDANTDSDGTGIDWSAGWAWPVNAGGSPFAGSNSIYTPAGTADRWLFTPQITLNGDNSVLTFDATTLQITAAGSESYEVYIATSITGATPAPADFSGSPAYANPTEGTTWTGRSIDLSTYSDGDVIYIAFRHISTNQQILGIDNIYVGSSILNDVEVVESVLYNSAYGYYGFIPAEHAADVQFAQKVLNAGENAQNNVTVNVSVNDGTSDIFTGTSNSATIAPSASDSLIIPTTFSVAVGDNNYIVAYQATQTETDETPMNNRDTVKFSTSGTLYSRGYSATTYFTPANLSALGAADNMVVANTFNFVVNDAIETITLLIYSGTEAGVEVTGKVYDATMVEIGSTDPYTITAADITNGMVSLTFDERINIAAGSSFTAGMELVYGTSTIQFLCDNSQSAKNPAYNNYYMPNYSTGASWINVNGTGAPMVILGLTDYNVSVNEIKYAKINVYPNPSTGLVNISNAGNATINVYNQLGALVKTVTNTSRVDLSSFAKGTYIVKVISENNTIVKQVVLN